MRLQFVTFGLWTLIALSGVATVSAQQGARQPDTKGIVVERTAETTRNWAVVIGVNQYLDPKIPNLKYAVADARLFAEQLVKRCGYQADRVLLITDDQEKAHLRPLKINLDKQLPSWLENVQQGDTILLFFSGHGFLDKRGQGFLAPQNCRLDNLGLSGLRTENLRDMLNQCKATRKVLVLDCCHSGSGKSLTVVGHSAQELGLAFQAAEGLVTLASSRKQQMSHEWEEKQHGLFTYYLVEGLAGKADFDGNRIVDVDELYRFTFDKVSITAQRELNARQTPVRIIGDDVVGVFPLARVAAATAAPLKREEAATTPKPPTQELAAPQPDMVIEAYARLVDSATRGQWEAWYDCFTSEGQRGLDSLLESPHLGELHRQRWFEETRGGARLAAVLTHIPELGFRLSSAVQDWRILQEQVTGREAVVRVARSSHEGEQTAAWSFRLENDRWKAEVSEKLLEQMSEMLGREGRVGWDERPRDGRGSPAEVLHAMTAFAAQNDWGAFYDCFTVRTHPVFDRILENDPELARYHSQPWFHRLEGRERFAEVCGFASGLRAELQGSTRDWQLIEEHIEGDIATLAIERAIDGRPQRVTRPFRFERGGWKSEALPEMLAMAEPRFQPEPGLERRSPVQVYEIMQDLVRHRDWSQLHDHFCAEVRESLDAKVSAETGPDSPLWRLDDPRERFAAFVSERPSLQESLAEEIVGWRVREEMTGDQETRLLVFVMEGGRVHESSRTFVLEGGQWKAAFVPDPLIHRSHRRLEFPPR